MEIPTDSAVLTARRPMRIFPVLTRKFPQVIQNLFTKIAFQCNTAVYKKKSQILSIFSNSKYNFLCKTEKSRGNPGISGKQENALSDAGILNQKRSPSALLGMGHAAASKIVWQSAMHCRSFAASTSETPPASSVACASSSWNRTSAPLSRSSMSMGA